MKNLYTYGEQFKKVIEIVKTVKDFGKDIYVPVKTTVFGVFNFCIFLNMVMLLSEKNGKHLPFFELWSGRYSGIYTRG